MHTSRAIWASGPSQVVNTPIFVVCMAASAGLSMAPISPWLACAPLLPSLWVCLQTLMTRYALYDDVLDTQSGVLSPQHETLELYRIKDYRVVRPLWLRPMGLGHVEMHTSDRSTPILHLRAIKQPLAVRDQLRVMVEAARDRKGVREFD